MNQKLKGILMVLVAATFWGLLSTFAQIIMQKEKFDPSWLISIRLLGSGLPLLAWSNLFKSKKSVSIWDIWKDGKDAFGIILIGIFGLLGVQYTYFLSIQSGNGVTTSLLHFLGPAFVLIYFSFRSRKLPSFYEWTALTMAFVGTFLLVTDGSIDKLNVPLDSIFWGIVSAVSGAFYLIYPVKLIKKWGPSIVVGWSMTIGGAVMSIFAPPWESPAFTIYSFGLLVYIVLFGTLFGFILYLGSLKYISSVEAGILSCIEPFVASISSYFLLQRLFGTFEVIGGLFIIFTVCLITLYRRHPSSTKQTEVLSSSVSP